MTRGLLSCAMILLLISNMAAEEVSVWQTGDRATIENTRIQVEFDLARGTYRAVNKNDGSTGFREGCVQIGEWSSTREGTVCRATDRAIVDGLGTGRTLCVECVREGQPTLLLEITLYAGKSFLTLGAGIVNTVPQALRLKEFYPLTSARAFPEAAEIGQAVTLNGEGGGRDTTVQAGPARWSSNNVLMTFRESVRQSTHGRRHSVILGGLTYHEWMKWAGTWPAVSAPSDNSVRRWELSRQTAATGRTLAAYLDCGAEKTAGTAPGVQLRAISGKPYDFASTFAPPYYNTALFDEQQVEIDAAGLDPKKNYVLGFTWWDYTSQGRTESVFVEPGDGGAKKIILDKSTLPGDFQVAEHLPMEKIFAVPQAVYASGKMKIYFVFDGAKKPGSNSVVSEVWLAEGPPELAAKPAVLPADKAPLETEKEIYLHVMAKDPVGRRIDPGERYLPEDRFYLDFATVDPFEAAEQYGLAVRAAQRAQPNPYTFPTICSWWAGVTFEPDAQNHPEKSRYGIATTKGLVEEMDLIRKTDFLKYSAIALRLVPDSYTPNNPQGWFDDQHWREQGFYTAPYETSEKWGKALQERGGLAITYFQPDRVSADFREAHPELLLPDRRNFDYTKPETQQYLRGIYSALHGCISGMMFDYCDELWCFSLAPGGFADDRATAASVYRIVFQLAKEGLGPNSWIHERPVYNPGSDMAVGLIDSQRTSGDTVLISPKLISRSGLRWYKNRVLFAYDMDGKNLINAWKQAAPNATEQDGRRTTLTMCYVAASRLLLANSLRDLPPEAIRDLERTLPYHTATQSARPVDAFVTQGLPRVYDFAVNPDWHQVTLLNTDGTRETSLSVPLSGEVAGGSLGLDPKAEYYFYDFWNDTFAGKLQGSGVLKQTLRAGESRMLSVHRIESRPQFLSTNRHLMQGYIDLVGVPRWDAEKNILFGTSKVVGGAAYQLVLSLNGYRPLLAKAAGATTKIEPIPGSDGLVRIVIESSENADIPWTVKFQHPD